MAMAEEDSKKMVKRAYVEIILNTAKEAAAQIMVSEKKAVRFQQDLFCTKDEALRMLLRLKQMIDAKTVEAEMTSFTQQKKIDELEAQLHEAEDIITDLRSELDWLCDKLEKQKTQTQSSDGQIVKPDITSNGTAAPQDSPTSPSDLGLETSDMKSTVLSEDCNCSKTTKTEQNTTSDLDRYSVQKTDLPSIFVRSKEPEQYRNGCTQRIHALDRNFNGKLLEDANDHHQSSTRPESVFEKDVPIPNIKNMDTLHRRKILCGKAKATPERSHPELFVKSCQTSFALSSCITSLVDEEDDHGDKMKTNGDLEEEMQRESTSGNSENKVTDHEPICCNGNSSSAFVGTDSGKNQLKTVESESKMKSLTPLNPRFTRINSNVDSKLGLKNVNEGLKVPSQSSILQHAAKTVTKLRREVTVANQEVKIAENPTVSRSKMVIVPLLNSDRNELKTLEDVGRSPCKVESDKFLKYTFQRKRKRESLIDPGNSTSSKTSAIKRRTEEKQDATSEKHTPSSVDESARSSRRLAQVANQLISLSGKR